MATFESYEEWSPQEETLTTLARAKEIMMEYADEGLSLTLRQLYYQFVSRNFIPNEEREYNRLGRIVSKGRRAGYLPWGVIKDQERNLRYLPNYTGPDDIISQSASRFHVDLWKGQRCRPEILVEKKALQDIVKAPANDLDVDYAACKGYLSDTFVRQMAQRHRRYMNEKQQPVVIHLGDHDPSGINMTEDIREKLAMYGAVTKVDRVALNMEQINEHDPPPQPAKVSDSRYEEYAKQYGTESWELDALPPDLLDSVIRSAVKKYREDEKWNQRKELEKEGRRELRVLAERWEEIEDEFNLDE